MPAVAQQQLPSLVALVSSTARCHSFLPGRSAWLGGPAATWGISDGVRLVSEVLRPQKSAPVTHQLPGQERSELSFSEAAGEELSQS